MNEKTIQTKADYLYLSKRGKLGNFMRSWDTLADLKASDYSGYITVRSLSKHSPWMIPVVHKDSLDWFLPSYQEQGMPAENEFFFQQIPPLYARRLANLEAGNVRPGFGLDLTLECNTTNPVRGIHKRGTTYSGLAALVALRSTISAQSFDTLIEIWDEYPSAIIEATEFSKPCGEFNQRLVVWEVRDF